MLQVGDAAPEFELKDGAGNTVRLAELRGRKVVLYFYPRDNTPGCTQEACDFRDRHAELRGLGAVLLGVSPDGEQSHRRFAAKYALPFPLLADEQSSVAEAYGVWKEKAMYGKTYMGVARTTFLIDEQGRIARIWPKVKVAGHGDEVLAALRG